MFMRYLFPREENPRNAEILMTRCLLIWQSRGKPTF